jgi:GT2 family glycosyltransferase
MTKPTISIAIATLNRCEDLRVTVLDLQKLDPPPLEILVCLDGNTDGSSEMLAEFPSVTVIANELTRGSVYSRDRLFRMAQGDLIVSLDDDSSPLQKDFVARLANLACAHPEAGAFAFEEVRPKGRDDRPFGAPTQLSYVASYANCASAVRAKLYGDRASYPHLFFHMYEEPDFCLQTYGCGYGVLYDPDIKVLHRYSHVGRNMIGRHHQHARNELLSVLVRCPFPHVFWVAAYRVARQFIYAVSEGTAWAAREPIWWWNAAKCLPSALKQRRPLPWPIYWQWMRLARKPIIGDPTKISKAFPAVASRFVRQLDA